MFKNPFKKEEKITQVYYGEVLDNEEIARIGEEIVAFQSGEVSYDKLKLRMLALGYPITVTPTDYTKFKALKDANDLKARIETETYEPNDIISYNTKTRDGIDIFIHYDRRMMDVLAEHGNEYATKQVTAIREWEARHGGPKVNK